jgi:hypothetical protein
LKYLCARDIAERRRISLSAARRWLAELEAKHGPLVVGRIGHRLFTTEEALARVMPGFGSRRTDPSAALEERLRRLARSVRVMQAAVERLEGQMAKRAGVEIGIRSSPGISIA